MVELEYLIYVQRLGLNVSIQCNQCNFIFLPVFMCHNIQQVKTNNFFSVILSLWSHHMLPHPGNPSSWFSTSLGCSSCSCPLSPSVLCAQVQPAAVLGMSWSHTQTHAHVLVSYMSRAAQLHKPKSALHWHHTWFSRTIYPLLDSSIGQRWIAPMGS